MATSTVGWQRVRIPPVERVLLADIAARRGKSEEETLAEIICKEALNEAKRACREGAANVG
jgi:hypothetical protein